MMARSRVLLFSAALLLMIGSCALAQQEEILILDDDKPTQPSAKPEMTLPADKGTETPTTNYETFYQEWIHFVDAVQNNNAQAAQSSATNMLDLKAAQNIPKLTDFALSAVRFGQIRLQAKDNRSAEQYFAIATKLDPTLSSAYYNEANAQLSGGFTGAFAAVVSGAQGFLAPRKHLRGHLYFNSKIIFIVLAAFAITGAIFALILLVKYNHLLRHDVEESYSRRFSPTALKIGVWVLLFVPVILLFGALWLAPFWLMIFVRYARLPEKIAVIVFIPVFMLAGPAAEKVVHEAALLQDPTVSAFYPAFLEGPSPRAIQDLQSYAAAHPDDSDAVLILASLYERNQMMNQAIELLQKLVQASPQDARPVNNLASVYFNRGELDYALRLATLAAGLDSRNAIYKFNLSNIYRAKFDFNEANTFMETARKTNPVLVDELERTSHEKFVDVVPTPDLLEKRLAKKHRTFFSFFLNPFSILGGLLLLGAGLRLTHSPKQVVAKECMKCGMAFCKKCQPNTKIPGFCIQCLHIFVRKDGVSPASRKEKMEEIEHYSRRQRLFSRIASLLIPGTGTLLKERTAAGLGFLLLWFLVLTLLVYTGKFAGVFFFEPAEAFRIVSLVCFVLLGVLYIVANLPSRKTKSS